MAIRTAINYIANFIRLHSGGATYLPASVEAGSTKMRVLNPNIFDPAGGSCFSGDSLITYTHINIDQLCGIPSFGNGAIAAALNEYTHAIPSLIYIQGLSEIELEELIDRFRSYVDSVKLKQDVAKKVYWGAGQWFDTDVELRDDNDNSYTTVTPDTIDYENGTFQFTTPRTESTLYVAGWKYNPFYVLAEIYERAAADDSRFSYMQLGQLQLSKKDMKARAEVYRQRGHRLSL
ncbi:MAG: hypothetical protein CV087_20835 [Candidatus Brocadia sp. WS118]|nr:MAG: hypothetical protein CV087_20835 [Candidatus Brocadia sp. WS118]